MMTKAAFVSGLQTERHCDVQGSSAHIRVFVGGHDSRGLACPAGNAGMNEQSRSTLLVWFLSLCFVFPIIP